ncbi:hypothetical protein D3C85_1375330 [compost metagenome]
MPQMMVTTAARSRANSRLASATLKISAANFDARPVIFKPIIRMPAPATAAISGASAVQTSTQPWMNLCGVIRVLAMLQLAAISASRPAVAASAGVYPASM